MLRFSGAVLLLGMLTGILYFDSILAGAIICIGLSLAYPAYKDMMDKKKKKELLLQFKDLLYSISASMTLGRNMRQAMEESLSFWKNIYDENDEIVKEVRHMIKEMDETGETDVNVLRNFALRSGLPDVMDFVNVYESCKSTGGNMPKAISRATDVIGDKISMEKELDLALTEKRAEGRIVGMAPFVLVLGMRLLSPEYLDPVYKSAGGTVISAMSLGLTVLALLLTERINRIEF